MQCRWHIHSHDFLTGVCSTLTCDTSLCWAAEKYNLSAGHLLISWTRICSNQCWQRNRQLCVMFMYFYLQKLFKHATFLFWFSVTALTRFIYHQFKSLLSSSQHLFNIVLKEIRLRLITLFEYSSSFSFWDSWSIMIRVSRHFISDEIISLDSSRIYSSKKN